MASVLFGCILGYIHSCVNVEADYFPLLKKIRARLYIGPIVCCGVYLEFTSKQGLKILMMIDRLRTSPRNKNVVREVLKYVWLMSQNGKPVGILVSR